VVLLLVQIYLGALVAGLDAGLIYNTWPLMDGRLLPPLSELLLLDPAWRNLFENVLTVQFNHRLFAYALWLAAAWHALDAIRTSPDRRARLGAVALAAAVTLQAILGILTLVLMVPISIALLHQGVAVVVLMIAVIHAAHLVARPVANAGGSLLPGLVTRASGSPVGN
jgi:cytochrome c oxidase assembly protein subunit 15